MFRTPGRFNLTDPGTKQDSPLQDTHPSSTNRMHPNRLPQQLFPLFRCASGIGEKGSVWKSQFSMRSKFIPLYSLLICSILFLSHLTCCALLAPDCHLKLHQGDNVSIPACRFIFHQGDTVSLPTFRPVCAISAHLCRSFATCLMHYYSLVQSSSIKL